MKLVHITLLFLLFLGFTKKVQAQNLPPVTFGSGTNLCDPSPWNLVFYDDFNGTDLDRSKWHSYNSFPHYESDNWTEGRTSVGTTYGQSINLDRNVVVSNGTCKLIMKHEAATWVCDTCTMAPVSRNYTSGMIGSYWSNYFNSGKFEARIQFPTYKWAHSCFWYYYGSRVNEIDVAECYGDPFYPWLIGRGGNYRYNNYSLHAWPPNQNNHNDPNPYNLTHHEIRNRFPHQTWADHIMGTYHMPRDWHIYTCEWDTAVIKFYLDGSLVSTQWKYYQDKTIRKWPFVYNYKVGSECNPDPGTWNVLAGFPYNNLAYGNITLNVGLDRDESYSAGTYEIGKMEIDYVKVWQKHPQDDNHIDLCNAQQPVITGPDIICNQASFNASPPITGGTWAVNDFGSSINVLSSNSGTLAVQRNFAWPYEAGIIRYNYTPVGCPEHSISKWVDVGPPTSVTTFFTRTLNSGGQEQFNLSAFRPFGLGTISVSPTTYEWDIDYAGNEQCQNAFHYHAVGQFVSTPLYPVPNYPVNCIKWTLKVTNACGTVTKTGQKTYAQKYGDNMNDNADATDLYFDAIITDSAAYQQQVYDRVAALFVPSPEDTNEINSMIERIRNEELAPYILVDNSDTAQQLEKGTNPVIHATSTTKIYPNPTSGMISIVPGASFVASPIEFIIYDLTGKAVYSASKDYDKEFNLVLDISTLSKGTYTIELKQDNYKEFNKIQKN